MILYCPSCRDPLISKVYEASPNNDALWICPKQICSLRNNGHYFYLETRIQTDSNTPIVSWGIPVRMRDKMLYLRSSLDAPGRPNLGPTTEIEEYGLEDTIIQVKRFFDYPGNIAKCQQIADRIYSLVVFS